MTRDELIEAMARAMLTEQMERLLRTAGLDMDDDFLRGWLGSQVAPHALSAIEAAGFAVVPKEATGEMKEAGFLRLCDRVRDANDIYAAMIATSPARVDGDSKLW
jgi:hypothetical protein